jgi:hypothetical protein
MIFKKIIWRIIISLTKLFGLYVLKLFNLFNYYILNAHKFKYFESEQILRKKLDLFDFENLSKSLPLICKSIYLHNHFYGHEYILKKYAFFKTNLPWIIEHGVAFEDDLDPYFELFKDFELIVTFGDHRTRVYNKSTSKKIINVGPYIHYANSILNKTETDLLKNKLGKKVLLVFPMHATNQIHFEYNQEFFIAEINKRKIQYDSVLICMYWKDIQLGLHKKFLENKYLITCAGHIMDQNFLARLKSIINLSDYVLCNSIGTHLGYAYFMNKKVEFIEQGITKIIGSESDIKASLPKNIESYKLKIDEVKKAFVKNSTYTEEDRYNLINDLWGFNHIKNPKELREMFEFF